MFSTLKLRFTTTNLRSSLFYNTSARHERHECDTSATGVRHKCDMNNTSVTRGKNFDFYNNTSENIFSHAYISYMENEILLAEEQLHPKNYLSEMHRSHAKMRLKSAPQKRNFVIAKLYQKVIQIL